MDVRRAPARAEEPALTALLALWISLAAALVAPAWALDGHGPAVVPVGGEPAEPMLVWQPDLVRSGAWAIAATGEAARDPFVRTVVDAEGRVEESLVGDVVGTTFSAAVGLSHRFGIGAALPVWWTGGTAFGDARVWAPVVALPATEGKLGLAVVPEAILPTGSIPLHLGEGGFGGGLRFVTGARGEHLGWAADLGGTYVPAAILDTVDRRVVGRLGLAGDWRPLRWLGVGVEGWGAYAPGMDDAAAEEAATSPIAGEADWSGEVLGRLGVRLFDGLGIALAGGGGLAPGVGASEARAYLRVSWGTDRQPGARAAAERAQEPTVVTPPDTADVRVHVHAEGGVPLRALIAVRGPLNFGPTETSEKGEAKIRLSPGDWNLDVSAPGYASQTRAVRIEPDRFRPVDVHVVLLPPAPGGASLLARVQDLSGAPVDAAVSLDGKSVGRTGTGGEVALSGLDPGARTVLASSPEYRPVEPRAVLLADGPNEVALTLERAPGQVKVVTRSATGPVEDAVVRFFGPEDLGPEPVGPTGERTWTLVPGHWLVAVSAAAFGLQEREIAVTAGSTALVVVDVVLRPAEPGNARLVVRVTDPSGAPVDGATVRLDGQSLGTTGNAGNLSVADLKPGPRRVEVSAPRFRAVEPRTITLAPGVQEVHFPLAWKPGQLRVRATGVEGALVDASVRIEGLPPTTLGPDGEALFTLEPGSWVVSVSSPAYGLQERDVVVRADDVTLCDMSVGLLPVTGDSLLDLAVARLDGAPVSGARVLVDDRDAGTTGSGGTVQIRGLSSGEHRIVVSADLLETWTRVVKFGPGPTRVHAELGWAPADVRVRARASEGPVIDALARFYGAEARPPMPLVPNGERVFALAPGPWTLVVSSPRHGFAERDLTVGGGAAPQVVDVDLATAKSGLLVSVVDPAGEPVRGVTLTVDGTERVLGEGGVTVLTDARGSVMLSARAPGFSPLEPERVAVLAGPHARQLRMRWLPRPVRVRVSGPAGAVNAEIRASGPGRVAPVRAGNGGIAWLSLLPGTWQILVDGAGYGAWRTDLDVAPGTEELPLEVALTANTVEVTGKGVEIREQIQFDFDQATIRPESYRILEEVVAAILLHPELGRIEVQGHTDIRGTDAYNLDLSQRRAEAVRQYLVRRGVDPGRLVAAGYGATKPVAPNETEVGRGKNRRVQFEVVGGR